MPTYHYRCADCGHEFDQYQKFSDDALTVCPSCNGTIRRVIQPVGVVFKGSGWYVTDSRPSAKPAKDGDKPAAEVKPDGEKPSSDAPATAGAESTTEAKEPPAAKKEVGKAKVSTPA